MINNRIFRAVFISLLILTAFVNCVGFVIDSFFYKIDDIPKGELISSSRSPGGTYTLKTYLVENCLGSAVRGELITRTEDGDIKTENIYWNTDCSQTSVIWENASLVNINGTMLDLSLGNTYDSRDKSEYDDLW